MRIRFLIMAVIVLVSGCSQEITIDQAYVKFFSEPDFGGLVFTVNSPSSHSQFSTHGDIQDFNKVVADGEQNGNFNDRATSVMYILPKGWTVIVFEHGDYYGAQYKLIGTGKVEKLSNLSNTVPPFDHKISSLRWLRE